ncbi:MAG TPA: PQQ-binding-like beta-propeller repeat protein [Candidatus Saccharimonadales bacterium]|nr:PQQ-binding-like beta-propeller repeat protein [Candidatus Saccharimonadales bacterium]
MNRIWEEIRSSKLSVAIFLVALALFVGSFGVKFFVLNQGRFRPGVAKALNGDVAWQVFDGGADDPGTNYNESAITQSNVHSMAELWSSSLPIDADNAIVEQPNVSTPEGVMDLVFVNTEKGNLIAYNAWNGTKIWEADPSSANWNGQGTKSAPAIDPSGNYVYAYAIDGYIHKYNIGTGTEVTGNGFPAQVTLLANNIEKGSASINIAGGYLYMTTSGNDGDYGHYVGHVIAVKLSNGTETVWNSECSNITQLEDANSGDSNYCANIQSGIWARPGVKVDPVTGNIFVATGNGLYDANSGGHEWGDSLIELKPDLSQIVDSYTPSTYASLQSGDADLGSTAPAILPTQNSSNTPYMLVQAGKDHIVRLLNRANLSGQSGPGHTGGELQTITISDEVHEQPAVWVDGSNNTWVFVTDESSDLYAYKLVTTSGTSQLVQQYAENIGSSSSPFIANNVLYLDAGSSILALNPTTGATLFNSSSISVGISMHWASPVVVNGVLYTPDLSGHLIALYVPGATVIPPTDPSGLQATSETNNSISLSWNQATDANGPGVGGYKIYRNGSQVGSVSGATNLTYTDNGLTSGTAYTYTVSAYDTNNLEGGQSASINPSTTGGASSLSCTTPAGAGNSLVWYSGQSLYGFSTPGFGTAATVASGYSLPGWAGVGQYGGASKDGIFWYDANTTSIYYITGGNLANAIRVRGPGIGAPTWACVGNFTGDGQDDSIAWYSGSTLYLFAGPGLGTKAAISGYSQPTWAGVGDYNHDGKDDLYWYLGTTSTIYALPSNGSTFTGAVAVRGPGIGAPVWAGVGNFSGSGFRDALAWYNSGTLYTFEGPGLVTTGSVSGYSSPSWMGVGQWGSGTSKDGLYWYLPNGTIYGLSSNGSSFYGASSLRGPGIGSPSWAGSGQIY